MADINEDSANETKEAPLKVQRRKEPTKLKEEPISQSMIHSSLCMRRYEYKINSAERKSFTIKDLHIRFMVFKE